MTVKGQYTAMPGDRIGEAVEARLELERAEHDATTPQELGRRAIQTSDEREAERQDTERRIEEQRENHERYFNSKLE